MSTSESGILKRHETLTSHGGYVPSKVSGQCRMTGFLHRVEQSLQINLAVNLIHPRAVGQAYSCMLIGICGMYCTPTISGHIWRQYELYNQLPVPAGLRDLQIVMLCCGLDHLDKGLALDPLSHEVHGGIMDLCRWVTKWKQMVGELLCGEL